ncbi:1,4-alpha-D-glucan 1-alpha-D-glucosylmutase [Acetobacter oeni LMG 21952]|nr:1,4-alpha-D-glucan 1-alpha-D-glucosylmutase [Acetobacter oeni LMG 21952]
MGLILDIVPNHMAVGGEGNVWWEDVLAWGQASSYARFFDINWDSSVGEMTGKIILPFLDRPYEQALSEGGLQLKFDCETGCFFICHHHHRFTVCPAYYGALLKRVAAPPSLCAAFCAVAERAEPDADMACTLMMLSAWSRTENGRKAISEIILFHNPETVSGREKLHHLIGKQNWVATWWRLANETLNWRRFFDNTELGAIAVERVAVFDATHAYIVSLFAEGLIDGVRVDHIDGLTAPAVYCDRLHDRFARVAYLRPSDVSDHSVIYVEKILGEMEHLSPTWRVNGTTGYEFMDQVSAVLHDENGRKKLDALWEACASENSTLTDIELNARDEILSSLFPTEFAKLISRIAEALKTSNLEDNGSAICDNTEAAIAEVMRVVLRYFGRYRTYYADDMICDHYADQIALDEAVTQSLPKLRASLHSLLRRIVTILRSPPEAVPCPAIRAAQRAFEHLTAPLAAKSVEDTAFYRYVRLISRNEVGSNPGTLASSVSFFHASCARRLLNYPDTMITTATHDHKRGEDSRMRIAVISEAAGQWYILVQYWLESLVGRSGPDRIDALMLYQTLLGIWPLDGSPETLAGRLSAWFTKALREGKRHTSWLDPDDAYETACQNYLATLLNPELSPVFISEMTAFLKYIAPAAALNSLSQTLLRLTTPGMPDLYQGCELWDFSLVDPDNRRSVDYAVRTELLRNKHDFEKATGQWRDGSVKFALIYALLRCRASYPDLFARGSYEPVDASNGHLIIFRRVYKNTQLLVIAPRHVLNLKPDEETLTLTTMPGPVYLPESSYGIWSSVIRQEHKLHVGSEAVHLIRADMAPVECFIMES